MKLSYIVSHREFEGNSFAVMKKFGTCGGECTFLCASQSEACNQTMEPYDMEVMSEPRFHDSLLAVALPSMLPLSLASV